MLAGPNSKRESAPEPLSLSHHSSVRVGARPYGRTPTQSFGLPEDTLMNGSDSFDVNGLKVLATLTYLELHLLTITQDLRRAPTWVLKLWRPT